jgi:hypothetical protein
MRRIVEQPRTLISDRFLRANRYLTVMDLPVTAETQNLVCGPGLLFLYQHLKRRPRDICPFLRDDASPGRVLVLSGES